MYYTAQGKEDTTDGCTMTAFKGGITKHNRCLVSGTHTSGLVVLVRSVGSIGQMHHVFVFLVFVRLFHFLTHRDGPEDTTAQPVLPWTSLKCES